MGMIMHDDVPYGEGTSYTQGTGIAINNNVIAVDADNTPTAGSEKPVKSKGVYEVVEQIYADNGVLGAKNLFKWDRTPSSPQSGLTITRNDDGSVSISGTASATAYIQLTDMRIEGTYIASGCPDGGSAETYELQYIRRNSGSTADEQIYRDFGDGVKIESVSSKILRVIAIVRNGVTINNTFYPMLRLASDPDDTYVPYAMTNRELTEELTVKESAVTDIVEGASITNNHNNLYKQGKFVHMSIELAHVTATAYDTIIAKVPSNYKPRTFAVDCNMSNIQIARIYVDNSGNVKSRNALSDASFVASATWITD